MKGKTKKMTQEYWNTLDERTRAHSVRVALPDMPQSFAESLAREKVNVRSPWFKVLFDVVRQPEDGSGYKFVVRGVYYN